MCENHVEAAPPPRPHVPYGIIIAFLAVIAFWIAVLAAASGAFAQPYTQLPPVIIYAPPPPPVAIGTTLGSLVGGLVALPFQFLGGIFGIPFAPPVQLIPDGAGGWVPITNSRYDPVTGQFLGEAIGLPYAEPVQPETPPRPVRPRNGGESRHGCYDASGEWRGSGNPDCVGG